MKSLAAIIVSTIVMSGFIAICVLLFTRALPAESRELANIVFGGLVSMATTVVSYWLGSSAGSAKKDDSIARLTETDR